MIPPPQPARVIPFNRPWLQGAHEALRASIDSGHISGDKTFTARCREFLGQALASTTVLLTTSCTHALEMAALLLDLKPGDEVIVPSFTFVSTVNAFVLHGASPVFIDIRPDTLNLDERLLPELLSARTRAIVPVHYNGVGCEMDVILRLASEAGAAVVEDNAHGLFGRYRDRWLGTMGPLGALSFHETKVFTCGEGGALLVNNPALLQRAEIIREKGTDRTRFLRGQSHCYTWRDVGSSYLPADLLAALLWSQLQQKEAILERRRALWQRYHSGLQSWAEGHGVGRPACPAHCEQPSHMYYLILAEPGDRDRLIQHLGAHGIHATSHYVPLHNSPMGQSVVRRPTECPVTEMVSRRLVRLPLFPDLTELEQDFIIEQVSAFYG